MATPPSADRGNDPCLQIQVDLSAMLDGELDPASVRRVMVHSDVCAGCRSFLRGIRDQVRMHRSLAALGEGLEPVPAGGGSEEPAERAEQLRLRRLGAQLRRRW
ncbi:MAG: zf-HC2 domain-containing protein [Pseudomonadales bacterium]|nr:zf-HC2 domain-containing protein [Pseudomonadales bacterium]